MLHLFGGGAPNAIIVGVGSVLLYLFGGGAPSAMLHVFGGGALLL